MRGKQGPLSPMVGTTCQCESEPRSDCERPTLPTSFVPRSLYSSFGNTTLFFNNSLILHPAQSVSSCLELMRCVWEPKVNPMTICKLSTEALPLSEYVIISPIQSMFSVKSFLYNTSIIFPNKLFYATENYSFLD